MKYFEHGKAYHRLGIVISIQTCSLGETDVSFSGWPNILSLKSLCISYNYIVFRCWAFFSEFYCCMFICNVFMFNLEGHG